MNEKNDIFKSLADKLEEKEFDFNPSHWEAVESQLPSAPAPSTSAWNLKWVAGVGGTAIVAGIVGYNVLTNDVVENPVVTAPETKEIVIEPTQEATPEVEETVQVVSEKEEERVAEDNEVKQEVTTVVENQEEAAPEVENETPVVSSSTNESENSNEDEEELTAEEYAELQKLTGNNPANRMSHPETSGDETLDEAEESTEEQVSNEELALEIPNIFTPNNDGSNDMFVIKNLKGDDWQLYVFNKNGQLVYESKSYDNQWDGGDLPNGTYTYKLVQEAKNKTKSGFVELRR